MLDPSIANKPVVVVGAKKDRHGVVLAKNGIAKAVGVKTGDVYWEAEQKCGKNLVEKEANFPIYLKYSQKVRAIYEDYTDQIEAFGIDECWLDVTHSRKLFGSGEQIAEMIRGRVKAEIGLTVSVGVSWNKVFAKLGSDMKKPDAVTVITPDNYRETVWRLPVEDLLYVGKATAAKLDRLGINTIGELAEFDKSILQARLGKWGDYLYEFANGRDNSPVRRIGEEKNVKSIGNSLTVYRDLLDIDDVRSVIYLLSDSVAARLRESGLGGAGTVHISVRSSALESFGKQGKSKTPLFGVRGIAELAVKLFGEVYPWRDAVRSVSVSVSDFSHTPEQLDFLGDIEKSDKMRALDGAIDKLRKKYGNRIIQIGEVTKDPRLRETDIKNEHVIHPVGFFNNK